MLFLLLRVAIFGSLYIMSCFFSSVVEQVEEAVVVWGLLECHALTIGRGHKGLWVINFWINTKETEAENSSVNWRMQNCRIHCSHPQNI